MFFTLKTPFNGFYNHVCLKDYPSREGVFLKCTHNYSKGVPFNILIIYGEDTDINEVAWRPLFFPYLSRYFTVH